MITTEKFQNLKFPLQLKIFLILKDGTFASLMPKDNRIPKKYCSKEYELIFLDKKSDLKGDYLSIDIHSKTGEKIAALKKERDSLLHNLLQTSQHLHACESLQKETLHNIKLYSKKLKLCEEKLQKLKK